MEGSLCYATRVGKCQENAVHLERRRLGMAIGAALSQAWARSQADLGQATS